MSGERTRGDRRYLLREHGCIRSGQGSKWGGDVLTHTSQHAGKSEKSAGQLFSLGLLRLKHSGSAR